MHTDVTGFARRRREAANARADAEARTVPTPEAQQPKPLDRMNKAELTAKAAALGLSLPANAPNKKILELITAKLATEGK